MNSLIIRRERPSDARASRAVQTEAFQTDGGEEASEARLVDTLRASGEWIPALSLVAERDGTIVGHNVCSRGRLETPGGAPIACVGLGPIGVLPAEQGTGVGSALMRAMIGAADALDEPLVALLGSPDYYARFGFVASAQVGIEPPDPAWGEFFQVLPLTAWDNAWAGRFVYAPAFDDLG